MFRTVSSANATVVQYFDSVPLTNCTECAAACRLDSRCVGYTLRSSVPYAENDLTPCTQTRCNFYNSALNRITTYGDSRTCTSCWAACDSDVNCAYYSFNAAPLSAVATRCPAGAPTPATPAPTSFTQAPTPFTTAPTPSTPNPTPVFNPTPTPAPTTAPATSTLKGTRRLAHFQAPTMHFACVCAFINSVISPFPSLPLVHRHSLQSNASGGFPRPSACPRSCMPMAMSPPALVASWHALATQPARITGTLF